MMWLRVPSALGPWCNYLNCKAQKARCSQRSKVIVALVEGFNGFEDVMSPGEVDGLTS